MGEASSATNGSASVDAERMELEAVLSSQAFARAQRLVKLLEYISQKRFQKQADEVCEYSIATEVLGRPSDFDPTADAIARVEIHRLRKKLRDYYATEGANRALRIVIPSGMYTPMFVREGGITEPEAGNGHGDNASMAVALASPPQAPALPPPAEIQQLSPRKSKAWQMMAGIAALVVVAAIGAWRTSVLTEPPPPAGPRPVPVVPSADNVTRIIAGYDRKQYIDHRGNTWLADRFFNGGGLPGLPSRPHYIARTSDPILYQSGRVGPIGYNIPLKPGNYALRLHFVEPLYGPGLETGGGENSRVFDILLNGKTAITNFDIVSDAGGPDIADVRVFKDIQPGPDGLLRLGFHPRREQPLISAIEVEPAPPHRINPIRIVAQPNSVTDSRGQVWEADNYYMGGQASNHWKQVTGTPDGDLFGHERYGHFSYAIPVAPGSYTVNLYLAETYWGPDNEGGGSAGQRVFDVYCNGQALYRNLDIFKEAGTNHALIKRSRGLHPNAQGKLNLEFVPVVNYASVYAIEVLDEGR